MATRLLPLLLVLRVTQGRMNIVDRSVKCDPQQIHIFFEFDQPFDGSVYSYGHFMRDECKVVGNNRTKVSISLPINVDPDRNPYCGIRLDHERHDFIARLIVSEERNIIVQGMREFEIQCHYQLKAITLQLPSLGGGIVISSENNAQKDPSTVLRGSGQGAIPALDMAIRVGRGITGTRIQNAHIGQPITLDIFMEATGTPYDIQVYNCIAHDGSRATSASVTLLDDRGCTTEIERVLSDPVQTAVDAKGNKHVYMHLKGFQFSTSELVYFECQVNPCLRQCNSSQCGTRSLVGEPSPQLGILEEVVAVESRRMSATLSMDYPQEQLIERVPSFLPLDQEIPEDPSKLCMPSGVLGAMVAIFSIAILLCLGAALFVWHKLAQDRRRRRKNSTCPSL